MNRPPRHERQSRSAQRAQRKKAAKKRRSGILAFFVVILVLAGAGFAGKIAYDALGFNKPPAPDFTQGPQTEVKIHIPEGASGTAMGEILVEENVVASVQAFYDAFNANAAAPSIQAGTYLLKTNMSAADAVAALLDPGSRADLDMTVIPGATKNDVAKRLAAVAGIDLNTVLEAMNNAQALGLPAVAGGNVEGWLAPGSYIVAPDADPALALKKMIEKTIAGLKAQKVPEADWQKVLTIASVVEMEVNVDKYYPMVARVVYNRIENPNAETQGYLNMDSTVLYGAGSTRTIPTNKELADESNPYNTYKHKGLPPSPIGAVGEKALHAALNPEPGDWLYFTAVNLETGETKFAATKAEQDQNVTELSAYCSANPGACSGEKTS